MPCVCVWRPAPAAPCAHRTHLSCAPQVDEGEGGQVHIRSFASDGVDAVELPLAPFEIAKAFKARARLRLGGAV